MTLIMSREPVLKLELQIRNNQADQKPGHGYANYRVISECAISVYQTLRHQSRRF
jgi:hypothetical protein